MSTATSVDKAQSPNFIELLTGPIVTIKAGKEGESKTYLVHKPLLVHFSDFFRGALGSQNFKEGVTGEVTLDDVEPCILDMFLTWLYQQKLPQASDLAGWQKFAGNEDWDLWGAIIKLCILADRFMVPDLTRAIHDVAQYLSTSGCILDYNDINDAFENLPNDSELLEYIAISYYDMWKFQGEEFFELCPSHQLPSEFLHRLMKYVLKNEGN